MGCQEVQEALHVTTKYIREVGKGEHHLHGNLDFCLLEWNKGLTLLPLFDIPRETKLSDKQKNFTETSRTILQRIPIDENAHVPR